jgi:hypothetical protein
MNGLKLPTGKYLADILEFLPSGKIIFKFDTGCGATYAELVARRHSLLIEPYIPVILGKSNEKVLAVYGNITVTDIIKYFQLELEYFKIVSTPEGLSKIIEAAEELKIDIRNSFFLLIDECEKLIQDVGFRPRIVEAMDEFFLFKNRSFISATPIQPTDPRFKEEEFENFYIFPETKKLIPINLRNTNSIASTIKDYFNKNRSEQYLIFINSTERIAAIIEFLNIKDESQIFCSKESADKLKINGIMNSKELFRVCDMRKYNFFTSRFFTAFDMILNNKPNVLIVSDVMKTPHSALDPNTDIIQIVGRARKGVCDITHISNSNPHLISKSPTEVLEFLNGSKEAYLAIKALRDTTNKIGAFDVLDEALRLVKFSTFINKHDDSINHFMLDQEVYDNRIKGYYQSSENLIKAYEESERFDVTARNEVYNLDDAKIDKLKKGISEKEVMTVVCEAFEAGFTDAEHCYNLAPNRALYQLIETHNLKYKYYHTLGIDKIRELEYNPGKIRDAYDKHLMLNSPDFFRLLLSLKLVFKRKKRATGKSIGKILRFYFRKYHIRLKPTVTQLSYWFEVDPKKRVTIGYEADGKEVKGYEIGRCRV